MTGEEEPEPATTYQEQDNDLLANDERKRPRAKRTRNPNTKEEPSSYCDHHGECAHTTARCRNIQGMNKKRRSETGKDTKGSRPNQRPEAIARKFVAEQEGGRGQTSDNGRKRNHTARTQDTATSSPRRRINTIMRSLTSSRDSIRSVDSPQYQAEMNKRLVRRNIPIPNNINPIIFTDEDAASPVRPHNDPLVVKLLIQESLVTQVLVDTGSSVNVISTGILAGMDLGRRTIRTDIRSLTGFDGSTITTIGTVALPIYVGGTMTWFDFVIVDRPIAYDIILGTPWIHGMKAVTSTYHRCIKFPTPRGIFTLRGDPMMTRRRFLIEQKSRHDKPYQDLLVAKSIAQSDGQTLLQLL